jgi:hypothetical protein
MKGFISVDIPTKKYIKAFLINRLGQQPILDRSNEFGNKLLDVLEHKNNPDRKDFSSRYDATIRVYITMRAFQMHGANLNETNIKHFNRFLEKKIKERFYEVMDDAMFFLPVIEANLPEARRKLGIDIEAWQDDSMKKDYYRYRLKNNLAFF